MNDREATRTVAAGPLTTETAFNLVINGPWTARAARNLIRQLEVQIAWFEEDDKPQERADGELEGQVMSETEWAQVATRHALTITIMRLRTAITDLLAREQEHAKLRWLSDCCCIGLSRTGEREYETGKCPHQMARSALADTVT